MSNWNKLKKKIGVVDNKNQSILEESISTHTKHVNEINLRPNHDPEEAKVVGMVKRLREKAVALDCEMVGTGMNGKYSELARCSLVNSRGEVLYDEFVQPKGYVTDFRTQWSGIRRSDINKNKAVTLEQCQQAVLHILKGKLLVGHALQNDMKVLMLSHPRMLIRDTSRYPPFMRTLPNGKRRPRALKDLTRQFLGKTIQTGEHDSTIDARCTMELYLHAQQEWEVYLRQKKPIKQSNAVSSASAAAQQRPDEQSESDTNDSMVGDESEKEKEEIDEIVLEEKAANKRKRENGREEPEKQPVAVSDGDIQPLKKKKSTTESNFSNRNTAAKDVLFSAGRASAGTDSAAPRRAWVTKQMRRDQRKQQRQLK